MTPLPDDPPAPPPPPASYSSRFGSIESRRRFEREDQRRMAAIDHLFMARQNDATVNRFLDNWSRGYFQSFEDMLCQLALALVAQKAEYEKTAVKVMQMSPHPSVI